MKKSLVIVESPSKAKTINKFLGKDFTVKASIGHIRDLPESRLGVDTENGFIPEYVVIKRQQKTINEIKHEAYKSDSVYIATDPDREGEAIAWHIAQEIGNNKKILRALFNEITQNAVLNAINNPLQIDSLKVDAQQARRVLDRLVGYKVSPFLWKTLFKGRLSAGRVQSVALRLVCEREDEITAFVKEEYWTIHVLLKTPDNHQIRAKLTKYNGKKIKIADEKSAKELEQSYKDETFTITKIEKKKVKRNPLPPFTTSTLQQEASIRLGFSPVKTMIIAQQLYEGIELGNEGSVGLISYMRTDSTRISSEALNALRGFIRNNFGGDYLPVKARIFKSKTKGKVQDAHECIRPTYFTRPPDSIENFLTNEQNKLYTLIWNRTLACQMKEALLNQTSVTISAGSCEFLATGSELIFPGFLKLWQDISKNESDNGKDDEQTSIPPGLAELMVLIFINSDLKQHFTKPPPRYTESSLVKELDQLGIGRPSTYAFIISTLNARKYVRREKRKLIPADLGQTVNKIVLKGFPDIFNVNFTAYMESELDLIESGTKNYLEVVEGFYKPFQENLDRVFKDLRIFKQELVEKAGFPCDKCGMDMVIKWSKNGKFYACSGFPSCKNTKKIEPEKSDSKKVLPSEKAGFTCEKCGSQMVLKTSRYGKFYACSAYPECKNIIQTKKEKAPPPEKAGFTCEKCGRDMVIRKGKRGRFYACSGYPKCKTTKKIVTNEKKSVKKSPPEKAGILCKECGKEMVIKKGKFGNFYACSGYPDCKYTEKIIKNATAPEP